MNAKIAIIFEIQILSSYGQLWRNLGWKWGPNIAPTIVKNYQKISNEVEIEF